MANKTFVQNGTFTVADNDAVAFGASVAGTEIVKILSGVTGVKLDANFERLDLSGALSTYKFVVVSGTGLQIQNASDNSIVATLPNINQQVKIVFTDGAAILKQTGSTAFTLNDANIVVGVTSNATTPSFTLSTWAVDLLGAAGIQSASSITVNSTEASNGKSIASAIQAPNDIDITKIKIVLAGANLDALVSKDQLVLDAAKSLNADFTGSNQTINSISGIDYAYTAATKTLTLTKNGGGALTASNVDNIVAGILFKTASTTQGIRTATISYVDAAGTESSSATTTLTVSTSTGPATPSIALTTDTGVTTDGITSDNGVTVSGLVSGLAWEYTLDAAAETPTWVTGTGSSFNMTADTTYAINKLGVRQTDAAGNVSAIGKNAAQWIEDSTAPTLSSSTPADGGTAIDKTADVVLTFSENMVKGTGNIVFTGTDSVLPGTLQTIAVSAVTISTTAVTINPADFDASKAYDVTIDATALTDEAGNAYAGISIVGTLDFTTGA